jgi:putative NIF3 family GTP cyclohydrolase 1 type 2
MNMCVIDAGHFNTENVIVSDLAKNLTREFPGIEVLCNNVEYDPFKTY